MQIQAKITALFLTLSDNPLRDPDGKNNVTPLLLGTVMDRRC